MTLKPNGLIKEFTPYTRVLDMTGTQAASGWTQTGSSGTASIADRSDAGYDSANGLEFIQGDNTGTYKVQYNHYNASGYDLSKGDLFTMSVLWEGLPSRWTAGSSGTIFIYMSSDGSNTFTNYVNTTLLGGTTTGLPIYGRNVFSWRKSDMTPTLSINWSSVKNIRLTLNTASATDRCIVQGLWLNRKASPKVAITFDDGFSDFITAASIANARDIPFTSFIIHDLIGNTPTYMTEAEVAALAAAHPRNQISGHNVNTLWDSADYGLADVTAAINWLKERDYDWEYYAYPGGGWNPNVQDVMRKLGIKCARSLRGISYVAGPPTLYQTRISSELVSPSIGGMPDWYQVNASPLNSLQTLTQCKASVDLAIQRGESVIFYGHKLGAVADTTTWVTSDYTALCDYIQLKQNQGLIQAVNMKELYAMLTTRSRQASVTRV